MANQAWSAEAITEINTAVKTNSALLNNSGGGVTVGLFVNNVIPNSNSTIVSLGESQNPSYTRLPLATPDIDEGFNSAGQNVNVFGEAAQWNFAAPSSPPETVYGYFLLSNTPSAATLIFSATLPTPIPVQYDGQVVSVLPQPALSNDIGGN